MAWMWIALFLLGTADSGLADVISCYNCNGTVEQAGAAGTACGWYKGWTPSNLDKRTGIVCPEGVCFTLMMGGTGQVGTIYRGCGLVTCDKLPRGWEKQEVCDSTANKVKTPSVNENEKFNDIRVFLATLPGNVNVSSLQYCDKDWCGTGGELIAQRFTTALEAASAPPADTTTPAPLAPVVIPVVVPPLATKSVNNGTAARYQSTNQPANNGAVAVTVVTSGMSVPSIPSVNSCIQCLSLVTEECGLQSPGDEQAQRVACNAGYCFTYVKTEAGSIPFVMRGCGGVLCNLIPGFGGSSVPCDDHSRLIPLNTTAGRLFNEMRFFYTPKLAAQSGAVQYCNNGPNCNAGPIPV
ncbi:uncharacterized protein LOC129592535 [Paramacrobiotus metropolitanus]|uniref:uncharacterized protein LOC129592535 n=1 Tax=Paramacrobiotus metropolitanus TaxID=2943436 RepID=UPI002445BB5F|nr:uncharacterized protein LOC129592535 [Paramacrobiotus metropolitanus]